MGNLAHTDPLQNHFQVKTKDVVTLEEKNKHTYFYPLTSAIRASYIIWTLKISLLSIQKSVIEWIPTGSTHHEHIWVDFVHLGQEEAKQSPFCSSYLHFPILREEGSQVHVLATYSQEMLFSINSNKIDF